MKTTVKMPIVQRVIPQAPTVPGTVSSEVHVYDKFEDAEEAAMQIRQHQAPEDDWSYGPKEAYGGYAVAVFDGAGDLLGML